MTTLTVTQTSNGTDNVRATVVVVFNVFPRRATCVATSGAAIVTKFWVGHYDFNVIEDFTEADFEADWNRYLYNLELHGRDTFFAGTVATVIHGPLAHNDQQYVSHLSDLIAYKKNRAHNIRHTTATQQEKEKKAAT
jgi:hypothetical protein